MKNSVRCFLIGLLVSSNYPVFADGFKAAASEDPNAEEPDTSAWQCKYCVLPDGFENTFTLNLANLSNDAFRYGNYSGIDEGSTVFIDFDLLFINKSGTYFEAQLKNAGLDSLSFESSYGSFGRYQLSFEYQDIPSRKYKGLTTPFTNPSSNELALPNDWIAFSGVNAPAVKPHWSEFDLKQDWQKIKLDWNHNANDQIDYQIKYQRTEKNGIREFSAAQIWNTSYLPLPIDHQIDQMDARMSYQGLGWWGSVNYQLSTFNNNHNSLRYTNPYIPLVAGSEIGEIAVEPDNKAYKIGVNFNYRFGDNTWAKLRASKGKTSQDQAFLPYTTNPALASTLPTSNLNAEVDTQDFSLRVYSRLIPKVSIRAKYRFHDQDNNSRQFVFQPVIADSFADNPITNLPYDYQTNQYSFGGDWRFLPGQIVSLEYRGNARKRNFSRVDETKNQGIEGKLRLSHESGLQFELLASKFERDASNIEIIDLLTVEENPLMRRYNQADRDEDKISFHLIAASWEDYSASINGDFTDLQYNNSEIGLQENRRINYSTDFNWHANKDTNLSIFYQTEDGEINMAASQSFDNADWLARSNDKIHSAGFNLQLKNLLDGKMDLLFELAHSEATNQVIIDNGTTDFLPDITSDWTSSKIELDYHYSTQWTFQFKYQIDQLKSADFAMDAVLPGTVNSLLTFGAASYNYDINYFVASFSYHIF